MSEETRIFRGDQAPEEGLVEKSAPVPRKQAPEATPAAAIKEVVPPAPEPTAAPAAPAAPVKPPAAAAPPLDFHLDETQLFHTPEAVRQRMSQLASIAHSTAHQLDEQAEEAERIAKRLKSI